MRGLADLMREATSPFDTASREQARRILIGAFGSWLLMVGFCLLLGWALARSRY